MLSLLLKKDLHMATLWGWQYQDTNGLNDHLFAIISSKDDYENIVRGRVVNTSSSLQNEYSSVFSGTGADNRHTTVAGILQGGIWANEFESLKKFENRTLITKAQSLQIWTGFQSQQAPLSLEFIAFRDPKLEVEGAISILEKWCSPQLNESMVDTAKNAIQNLIKAGEPDDTVFGYTPTHLSISFFGRRYNSVYVIDSISQSQDEIEIEGGGLRTRQIVELSLQSRMGLTKDEILI
jgi:hypothetical protein